MRGVSSRCAHYASHQRLRQATISSHGSLIDLGLVVTDAAQAVLMLRISDDDL